MSLPPGQSPGLSYSHSIYLSIYPSLCLSLCLYISVQYRRLSACCLSLFPSMCAPPFVNLYPTQFLFNLDISYAFLTKHKTYIYSIPSLVFPSPLLAFSSLTHCLIAFPYCNLSLATKISFTNITVK